MILELLPSSRASTLETNCVCNYSALLHLITRDYEATYLNISCIYIYIKHDGKFKEIPLSPPLIDDLLFLENRSREN